MPAIVDTCTPIACSQPMFREIERNAALRKALNAANEKGGTAEDRLDAVADMLFASYAKADHPKARAKLLSNAWGADAVVKMADQMLEACRRIEARPGLKLRCTWVPGASSTIEAVVNETEVEVQFLMLTPALTNAAFSTKSFDADFRSELRQQAADVHTFMEQWWDKTDQS